MAVVFSLDEIGATQRHEYWHEVVKPVLGSHDARGGDDGLELPHYLALGHLGVMRIASMRAREPGGLSRRLAHIRKDGAEPFSVHMMLSGRGVWEQDGRQAAIGPGDFVLVDGSRPLRTALSADIWCVAFAFPRNLLGLPESVVPQARMTGVGGDRGTGALVSSVLRRLTDELESDGLPQGSRLATTVLDLVTVALSERIGSSPESTRSVTQALLTRIDSFIDENLADVRLGPEMIAARHHISVRYLHRLFESNEASVAGTIRRRRLERCRRDLVNPAADAFTVSEIGVRWGLSRPAHFTRLFRARYGIPPAAYRRLWRDNEAE